MSLPKISAYLKLNLFKISLERQVKVYNEIKENATGDFDFFVLNIFSTIIITLGLLINSSAIVIGGMLLAPLVWPIFMISLSIIMGKAHIFENAFFTLIKAILVIFVISLVIGYLTPDLITSEEIIARSRPSLFDLFIAIASGFIGAFIISYPKLGSAMGGVAIAIALVPSIAVAGLAVSQNDMQSAGGSILLFLSNLVAIIFASGLMFLLAHFRGPSTVEGKEIRRTNIIWFILLFITVLIPLYLITIDTVKIDKREKIITEVISSEFSSAKVTDINTREVNKILEVYITLQNDQNLSKWEVSELTGVLSNYLEQSVVLQIKVIPVVEAGKLISLPLATTTVEGID